MSRCTTTFHIFTRGICPKMVWSSKPVWRKQPVYSTIFPSQVHQVMRNCRVIFVPHFIACSEPFWAHWICFSSTLISFSSWVNIIEWEYFRDQNSLFVLNTFIYLFVLRRIKLTKYQQPCFICFDQNPTQSSFLVHGLLLLEPIRKLEYQVISDWLIYLQECSSLLLRGVWQLLKTQEPNLSIRQPLK